MLKENDQKQKQLVALRKEAIQLSTKIQQLIEENRGLNEFKRISEIKLK